MKFFWFGREAERKCEEYLQLIRQSSELATGKEATEMAERSKIEEGKDGDEKEEEEEEEEEEGGGGGGGQRGGGQRGGGGEMVSC